VGKGGEGGVGGGCGEPEKSKFSIANFGSCPVWFVGNNAKGAMSKRRGEALGISREAKVGRTIQNSIRRAIFGTRHVVPLPGKFA
jgi:hypothetical protein